MGEPTCLCLFSNFNVISSRPGHGCCLYRHLKVLFRDLLILDVNCFIAKIKSTWLCTLLLGECQVVLLDVLCGTKVYSPR